MEEKCSLKLFRCAIKFTSLFLYMFYPCKWTRWTDLCLGWSFEPEVARDIAKHMQHQGKTWQRVVRNNSIQGSEPCIGVWSILSLNQRDVGTPAHGVCAFLPPALLLPSVVWADCWGPGGHVSCTLCKVPDQTSSWVGWQTDGRAAGVPVGRVEKSAGISFCVTIPDLWCALFQLCNWACFLVCRLLVVWTKTEARSWSPACPRAASRTGAIPTAAPCPTGGSAAPACAASRSSTAASTTWCRGSSCPREDTLTSLTRSFDKWVSMFTCYCIFF